MCESSNRSIKRPKTSPTARTGTATHDTAHRGTQVTAGAAEGRGRAAAGAVPRAASSELAHQPHHSTVLSGLLWTDTSDRTGPHMTHNTSTVNTRDRGHTRRLTGCHRTCTHDPVPDRRDPPAGPGPRVRTSRPSSVSSVCGGGCGVVRCSSLARPATLQRHPAPESPRQSASGSPDSGASPRPERVHRPRTGCARRSAD